METLAPAPACRHSRIRVETRRSTEFIDLTDRIDASLSDTGIRDGPVNIHTLHTTTAVLVNEREPLLLADFAALLARMAPQHALYRHDDMAARTVNLAPGERPNGHAHCRALLPGSPAIEATESATAACDRLQLNLAVDYLGGRELARSLADGHGRRRRTRRRDAHFGGRPRQRRTEG